MPRKTTSNLANDANNGTLQLEMLLKRISFEPDDSLKLGMARAKSKEDTIELLMRHYLPKIERSFQLGGAYEIPKETLRSNLAAILSGTLGGHELLTLIDKAKEEGKIEVDVEYQNNLKKVINRDTNQKKIRDNVWSAYKNLLSSIISLAVTGTIIYLAGNFGLNIYYDQERRNLILPYFTQVYEQEKNSQTALSIDNIVTLGRNTDISVVPYTALPSSLEAELIYQAAVEMPESEEVFTSKRDVLDKKILFFQQIIDTYPSTNEAYKSQFQIYIIKSFNQKDYTAEEISGSLTNLLLTYPNVQSLTTKQLVDFMIDYLTLEKKTMSDDLAAIATVDWAESIIAETKGTRLEFKLDYILATIYSGQTNAIIDTAEDGSIVVRIPEEFGIVRRPFDNLYISSMQGDDITASISMYSYAQALIGGRNLEDVASYDSLTDWNTVANLLEESIMLTEGVDRSRKAWIPVAYKELSAILAYNGMYNDAIVYLGRIETEFPSDNYIQSGEYQKRKDMLQQTINNSLSIEQGEFNKKFNEWYDNLEIEVKSNN